MVSTNRKDDLRAPASRSALAVPAATIGVNLISYLLLLCAARVLSKADYGELVAMLGVLLVATVPALALQTVAARLVATGSDSAGILRTTVLVATGSALALAAITPLLDRFLHLSSWVAPLAVAATVPANTLLGTYQGIAQGSRQFKKFAALIILTTGGRSSGGLIGVFVGRSPGWCLIGVAVGTTVTAAIGHALVMDTGSPGGADAGGAGERADGADGAEGAEGADGGIRHLLIEVSHAAHAHGAFLLLASLDVLLARHVLSADAAGVYAAGSVVTRAALWVPQSIALVLFPSLAVADRHRRTLRLAVWAVAGIGTVMVLGTLVLGPLVVSVVGGRDYHQLDPFVWMFAALGACLALIQLAILAGLALRRRGRIVLVWIVAAAEVLAVLTISPTTPRDTVELLLLIAGLGAAGAVLLAVDPRSRPASARTEGPRSLST